NHEPAPVTHLRSYSNYLDPKLGATSGDTWTLVATVLRNLMLNWFILIPLLATALLIPRMLLEMTKLTAAHRPGQGVLYSLLGIAIVFGVSAVRFVTLNLPAFGGRKEGESAYLQKGLLPFVFTAICLAAYWYLDNNQEYPISRLGNFCLFGFFVHAVGTAIAFLEIRPDPKQKSVKRALKAILASGVSGALGGFIAYVILSAATRIPTPALHTPEMFVVSSVPLVLGIFSVVAILLVGLTSKYTEDEDREIGRAHV